MRWQGEQACPYYDGMDLGFVSTAKDGTCHNKKYSRRFSVKARRISSDSAMIRHEEFRFNVRRTIMRRDPPRPRGNHHGKRLTYVELTGSVAPFDSNPRMENVRLARLAETGGRQNGDYSS